MSRVKSTAKVAIGACIAAALMLIGLVVLTNLAERVKCSAYHEETGRATRYNWKIGCMVNTPAGWLPREELRQVYRVNP